MFEIAPELQELFSFKQEDLTPSNERLKKHAVQVMESVGMAIEIIDDQSQMEEVLLELGIVHHMKGVKINTFAVSDHCIILYLGCTELVKVLAQKMRSHD